MMKNALRYSLLSVALGLAGCGGGGGGGAGPTTYTIGGTVSGLGGSSMVVNLTTASGTNGYTIYNNGTYTFPSSFADATAYTLYVAQQPTGNQCGVANGMGTIVAANVTNVDITCVTATRVWGSAQLIETDNLGNAMYPQVVVDASGNAMAVWQQSDGTRDNIWANRYNATTNTWGTAQLIENNLFDSWYPQVAVDASGNAMVVWQQGDGTRANIWANRYNATAGTWGTAQLIETDNAGDAGYPQVAVDASGNAIAVWYQSDGTRNNIWANRYNATTNTWGTAQLIETDNTGFAHSPQVAVDANGNAMAVWLHYDGTRANIQANRYNATTGTWGTAQLIETDNAGHANYPQVAIDASGNAIAVWQQSDGTRDNVWVNSYSASGDAWGTAQLIESADGGALYPQVAFDTSGNAIAVWSQASYPFYNIYASHYTASSGTWGAVQLIEMNDAGGANAPQIAFDANGNAVVAWQQVDGSGTYNVWSNRYAAGAGWGTAQLLETDNTGHASSPQVAVDASGNAVAVWYQSDGSRYNIMANHYR